MIKIVVDAFGGDNAPEEIVKGCVMAIENIENIHIVLSGKEQDIKSELSKYKYDENRISILNAIDVITNDESPTMAIKQKTDSSLVKAFDLAKDNEDVIGLLSAGSTGAVLTGGFLKFGRLKGISRPALCPVLPTIKGTSVCICDCGANMDCKPEYLDQFAVMGNAYLEILGVKEPRIGLLNVGTEDHKGDTRAKETFELLSQRKDTLNFVGNMEARDLLSGDYDLVVTDGFAGNVLLKSTEGAVKNILAVLKEEIKSSMMSKLGALFMKNAFKGIKARFDYKKHGGAVLLGCKKLLVKAHGSSNAESIAVCISQIIAMHNGNLIGKISEKLCNRVENE